MIKYFKSVLTILSLVFTLLRVWVTCPQFQYAIFVCIVGLFYTALVHVVLYPELILRLRKEVKGYLNQDD